jgi:hypothetical protein
MNATVMNLRAAFDGTIPILGEVVEGGRVNWFGQCQVCHCTDLDCSGCIERTGAPCSWANDERTLCTACAGGLMRLGLGVAVPSEEDCTS